MIGSIIRLRRDNDYNYAKIKSTFTPANGEICLVDTATDGLRAVCGDGSTKFGNLEYQDCIVWGYYNGTNFYKDVEKTIKVTTSKYKVFIDKDSSVVYVYNGSVFIPVNGALPTASSEIAGVTKLYKTTGKNEDGTMTQKSITESLSTKVSADIEGETLFLTV